MMKTGRIIVGRLKMLTSKEYVDKQGVICPCCQAHSVRGMSELQHDSCYIWQDCKCDHCNAEWTDEYTLTGYSVDEELDSAELEDQKQQILKFTPPPLPPAEQDYHEQTLLEKMEDEEGQ